MKILEYRGINIKIDKLFILMMIFYGFANVLPQAIIIFAVVLAHEISHVLVAIHYKNKIAEIVLFPFGGVAKLDFLEVDSNEEIRIAIAGPLTNFFLAGLGMAAQYYLNSDYWLLFFVRLNLIMGIFNLLPVLPLDGGRIFRAWYAKYKGVLIATKIAAKQGRIISIFLLLVAVSGLYLRIWDLNAVTMAAFLFYSAGEQDKTASFHFLRYLLKKKDIIAKESILSLKPYYIRDHIEIKEVLSHLVPNNYHLFYVFNDKGELVSTVSEGKLIEIYFQKGDNIKIGSI